MTHTPGPWRASFDDEPVPGIPAIMIETKQKPGPLLKEICSVSCTMNDEENFVLTEEDRANAQLIAAAPELLAALRDALPVIERAATEERRANKAPTGFPPKRLAWNTWQQCVHAIAKAAKIGGSDE